MSLQRVAERGLQPLQALGAGGDAARELADQAVDRRRGRAQARLQALDRVGEPLDRRRASARSRSRRARKPRPRSDRRPSRTPRARLLADARAPHPGRSCAGISMSRNAKSGWCSRTARTASRAVGGLGDDRRARATPRASAAFRLARSSGSSSAMTALARPRSAMTAPDGCRACSSVGHLDRSRACRRRRARRASRRAPVAEERAPAARGCWRARRRCPIGSASPRPSSSTSTRSAPARRARAHRDRAAPASARRRA